MPLSDAKTAELVVQKTREQPRTPSVSRAQSAAASRPSSPLQDTAISTEEIAVPDSTILDPGTAAGTSMEENVAPELHQHHDGAEAPMTEDAPEASGLGEQQQQP